MADRRQYKPDPNELPKLVTYDSCMSDAINDTPLSALNDAIHKNIAHRSSLDGRPSKYDPGYDEIVKSLLMVGTTQRDIAAILGIDETSFYNWARQHPSFFQAIVEGKELADAKVARAMFHRATGYSHADEKITVNKDGEVTRVATVKHYPPDTTAGIYWLNNRKGSHWKSSVDVNTTTDKDGNVVDVSQPPRITIRTTPSGTKE